MRDGLSTSNIYALMADGRDDVWAVTANGISRVRVAGRDSFLITNYGRFDGIDVEGREFRTCQIHRDTMGTITVGFVGGIVRFHPDSVTAPRYTFRYPRPFTADTLADTQRTDGYGPHGALPADADLDGTVAFQLYQAHPFGCGRTAVEGNHASHC